MMHHRDEFRVMLLPVSDTSNTFYSFRFRHDSPSFRYSDSYFSVEMRPIYSGNIRIKSTKPWLVILRSITDIRTEKILLFDDKLRNGLLSNCFEYLFTS